MTFRFLQLGNRMTSWSPRWRRAKNQKTSKKPKRMAIKSIFFTNTEISFSFFPTKVEIKYYFQQRNMLREWSFLKFVCCFYLWRPRMMMVRLSPLLVCEQSLSSSSKLPTCSIDLASRELIINAALLVHYFTVTETARCLATLRS